MSWAWIRSRRQWVTLLVLALLVGAYTAFGFYGVPRLADHLIRKQVAQMGHQIELGAIHFHPFRFEAQVEQLKLSQSNGEPLLGFAKLDVDLELWDSIRARGAVLRHLRLDAPDVSVVVEPDGKINLARLAPPPSKEPEPETPATIPQLRIDALAVRDGRVGIEDRSRPEPFATELRPVSFELKDFQTALGHASVYDFSGAASTGERIQWSGDFTVQPLGSKGRFAIENAQSGTATAYLQDQLPVRLLSGVAQTAGEYTLTLDPALALDLRLPTLTVRELALAEFGDDKAHPAVSVGEIAVADIALSLAAREVQVGGVDMRGVAIQLRREADGSLNLSRLVAPKPAAAATAPVPAPAPEPDASVPATTLDATPTPWVVKLGGLRVHAASIAAEDRAVKPALKLAIQPLDVEIGALTSALQEPIAIKAGTGVGARGRLDAQGTVALAPLAVKMDLGAKALDLSVLQPYLASLGAVELASAQLGLRGALDWAPARLGYQGELRLSEVAVRDGARKLDLKARQLAVKGALKGAGEPLRIAFDGGAALDGLGLRERGQRADLVAWQQLKIDGIAFSQARNRLDIARVDLVAPAARVEISPERKPNLATAFAAPESASSQPVATEPARPAARKDAAPALAVSLKTLRIQNGALDFADRSIDPAFAAAIQKLEGRIEGLSTRADASATVDLKGQVDAYSPVLIQGALAPLAYDRDTTLALSFRNMDLIRFNPYSGRFAGYNIEKGKLTTELKYRIQQRELQAEHHVIVDQLEFGEATGSKDAVPLPVKLAVALLKDRHGTIDLQLPVSGRLDDPQFRVGPVVWKVLVNLLTKAVSAPFAALGSLFGGGEDLQFVTFAPGQSTLEAAQLANLEKLARALVERPQLKLDVPYAIDAEADAQALARAALAAEFAALPPSPSADVRLEILVAMHARKLGRRPEFPPDAPDADATARTTARVAFVEAALLQQLRPDAAALEALAVARASAVQAALLAQPELAPERLFLTSRQAGALDEGGQVRMELKLE